jgi:S-methylmethionine-dependent homocysteine/selenocysteine methylase
MSPLIDRLATEQRPLLLDGATGTELNRRGVDTSLPLWSAGALLTVPNVLRQIHADYVAAGAEVITANTFRRHRWKIATLRSWFPAMPS